MIDDLGFGQSSTFGGPVPTPNLDKLADKGLKYTRFHVTALCSPTRAAMMTGRTHHQVGLGVIGELATGFPGYNSRIPKSAAMVSDVLQLNGYSTAAFGKWHLTPADDSGPLGPFDRWPTGQGFEYFYGFLGGETSQWEPLLVENTRPVHAHGKHVTDDIAERATNWLKVQQGQDAAKPFFLYWAPGAVHAPHHVADEWVEPFRGKFDQGWEQLREETLARQIKMGLVPAETKLAGRPPGIPEWSSLSDRERGVYSRMMEVYAGFLAHTDHGIGQLIDALDETGRLDNTLVIAMSDNGASAEGGLAGGINTSQYRNGSPTTLDEAEAALEKLGGPETDNHYPAGWAWGGNAPFNYFKQAQHLGGTRVPLIVTWPKRIKDAGATRSQFHYVTDLVPTILEAADLPAPTSVNGVPQMPLAGVSMDYTFDDQGAAERRSSQYFEMLGHRAIYHDGWYAVAFHGRLPWDALGKSKSFDEDDWELYNLDDDYSMANDLAESEPERLKHLKELWWAEAARHNALPLDDRGFQRALDRKKAKAAALGPNPKWNFPRGTGPMPAEVGPNTKRRDHAVFAKITMPESDANGLLVSSGGTPAGFALYVRDGKLVYHYNHLQRKSYEFVSPESIPSGTHEVGYEFKLKGGTKNGAGTITLLIDGQKVASGEVEETIGLSYASDETFDIGEEYGSPVTSDYADQLPFRFNGKIKAVDVMLR
jgi:arylsulfatase